MWEQLISDVRSLELPAGQHALFGSSPIIVRGLREASHDIDIVVTPELWDVYQGNPEWVTKPFDETDAFLEWEGHNIELYKTWGPGEWDVTQLIAEAELIERVPFVRLDTVLAWKKRNGRPKDLRDVALIEEYLAK